MATKVYRDFGALNDMKAPNNEFDIKRYTQVYQATHEGEQRLPFMNRSFISFSFDDPNAEQPKCIEDLGFIAYTAGDRIERDAYGSFEDLTSTYDVIPGQFYWGTYFHQNTLTFDLATDGIDQAQLDAFKYWFRPGIIRELILSEHPNRAILARVSSPPRLKLLPFKHSIELEMENNGQKSYKTNTTLYKGEVELEFVMDEPFWYAKKSLLGKPHTEEGYYDSTWKDVNGTEAQIVDSPDALKIIYEDHIPIGSMSTINVFYGDKFYVTMKQEAYSLVCKTIDASEYAERESITDPFIKSAYIEWPAASGNYYYGASIINDDGYGGRIAGANVEESTNGIELQSIDSAGVSDGGKFAYLYYAGNAPSPVTLSFTLTPQFNENYIVSPWNKLSNTEKPYNTITLESVQKHEFNFSLPTLYSSYNNVVTILKNETLYAEGKSWETIRETIRDTIRHPKVRAWANLMIDEFLSNKTTSNEETENSTSNEETENSTSKNIISRDDINNKGDLIGKIKELFLDPSTINVEAGIPASPYPATFTFDAKEGTAIGTFTIRTIADDSTIKSEELVENVGDMVKSNYIILDERNVLGPGYLVQAWTENNKDYAYKITHNIPNGLNHLQFKFKNRYL